MLHRIYKHLIAPKLALAAASRAAARVGLRAFEVAGSNMAPTLEPSQVVWYQPGAAPGDLARGQIVALSSKELGAAIVPSRVVALPGETVELREGMLFVDGVRVPEPYVGAGRAEQDYSVSHQSVLVPQGHVWLLGDFRDMSKDSRHIGPVPLDSVLGRATHWHPRGQHGQPRPLH